MYERAMPMQATLAVVGSTTGLVTGVTGAGGAWILGALVLFAVIPFTLVRLKPLNDRLLDPTLGAEAPETLELLREWGRLHRVRSIAGGFAFLCFLLG
jgi:hypothetical protein